MTTKQPMTEQQMQKVLRRIALMARLTANAMRDAPSSGDYVASVNMLEAAALLVDCMGALADSASGYQTNGSFEEWMVGNDFHIRAEGP